MAEIIDGIELDPDNKEFNSAINFVENTDRIIYLTGHAGTGKTTFLKYLRNRASENTVILAPTGVAAVNAGGQTIHSFFHLPLSLFVPGDRRFRTQIDPDDEDKSIFWDHFTFNHEHLEVIRNLELLVIDEVSMVRCDIMDAIDSILRILRDREDELFGGAKLLLIGDTFQLPPIVKGDEWDILKQFYNSEFFFSSKAIVNAGLVYIELKKIYRQSDIDFIQLLNKVRVNAMSGEDMVKLNSRYNSCFKPKDQENYIILATHNYIVQETNQIKLIELDGESIEYKADIIDEFPSQMMPTDSTLILKSGAQIMFIRNHPDKLYYSGKIGIVEELFEDGISVRFEDGDIVVVKQEKWENRRYTWNPAKGRIEEQVVGWFFQLPIKLAWAITVHKSQGLTFSKVIADLSKAFAPGQIYVALSRCTSFEGLVLKSRIDRRAIKADERVIAFSKKENLL